MSTSTTQQFEGCTIEEALSAAVSTLGDDVEIVDAQKVVKRQRFSVRKKERFEVTAVPRGEGPDADPDSQFESVLRAMVDKVDDEERAALPAALAPSGGVDLADSDHSWWSWADFIVPDEEARPRPSLGRGQEQPAPATTVEAVQELLAAPTAAVDLRGEEAGIDLAGSAGRHARMSPAPTGAGHGWSREALLEMGLPAVLVDRVTAHQLRTDLEWVGAMASAIDELLAAAQPTESKCALTGYGHAAAVELIVGAFKGLKPGHLVVDGAMLEATPTELALGVRASLRT